MNQLATQAQINLPEKQKEFVLLRVGNKQIKDLNESVVKRNCAEILTKASFDMGSPMANDPKLLQFQTEALFSEVKGKFSILTLPELSEAFKKGIRGESGPYFGMCPKTYHQFIKYFFELPERGKAWNDYLSEVEKGIRSDKSVVMTKEFYRNAALTAFNNYKISGALPYSAFAMYEVIKEIKGVETLIDQLDWQNIKEEAKSSYSDSLQKGRVKKVKMILDYTLGNVSFENHVKKIALKYYFENLIQSNKELEI